jgi:hypothetical protein
MDQRDTFKDARELLYIIEGLFKKKEKAALIVDREGLVRMAGLIVNVDHKDTIGQTVIHIDGPDCFLLDQVIAVNGIFRSDYSEC